MKKTSRNSVPVLIQYAGFIGIVFLLLIIFIFRGFFTDTLLRILGPIYAHNPVSEVVAQVQSKAALSSKNAELSALLASTTAALVDRAVLYQENVDLKSRLNRDGGVRTVLAGILLRPPGTPYDTLVIDAGRAQAIAIGDYVSAGGTSIIGEIDSVEEHSARVVLFSSPNQSNEALLLQTATHGVLPIVVNGQGGSSMITEVPAHTDVKEGDAVVFPGINGGIEAIVTHVEAKLGESFEKVYLHLPTNPLQLRYVEVLTQ